MPALQRSVIGIDWGRRCRSEVVVAKAVFLDRLDGDGLDRGLLADALEDARDDLTGSMNCGISPRALQK